MTFSKWAVISQAVGERKMNTVIQTVDGNFGGAELAGSTKGTDGETGGGDILCGV